MTTEHGNKLERAAQRPHVQTLATAVTQATPLLSGRSRLTPEQRQQAIRERDEREEQARKQAGEYTRLQLQARMRRTGFGEKHIQAKTTVFDPPGASGALWAAIKKGGCVAIVGNFGRGKTQLACEATRFLIASTPEGQPLYVTGARFMEVLKKAWGGEGQDPRDVWRKCPLLAIDDIHAGYDSKAWEVEAGDLLDARYYDFKPTVLIANLTPADFAAKVGGRIASRINDGGGIIELRGVDRRGA